MCLEELVKAKRYFQMTKNGEREKEADALIAEVEPVVTIMQKMKTIGD